MRERLMNFMSGRYGMYGADALSKTLSYGGLVCVIVSMFLRQNIAGTIFYFAGLLAVVYSLVRLLSRNVSRCTAQNEAFLRRFGGIRNVITKRKYIHEQKKIYRFYNCPQCKQKIRVPKGRGKIEITCPKCRTAFIKKS